MPFNTLSGRFLALTVVFVMLAEVMIFVPSVARFRVDYLQNRLELAQLAALALLATPDEMFAPDLEAELLETADVLNVVLRRDGIRELVLSSEDLPMVADTYDLTRADAFTTMGNALRTLFSPADRVVLVIGRPRQGAGGEIETVLHEAPLRAAMVEFGLRILYVSLFISILTAALLFLAVRLFIVRPIKRVVDNMTAYRDDPTDARRIITPQTSARELRQAEIALHDLQVRLSGALRQRERLAALGTAVAKISHDLRNLLTTAQLFADRIEISQDPAVRRSAPKLVNSLSRAISLCERTLVFGKAEEPPPVLAELRLAGLVAEVIESERGAEAGDLAQFVSDVPENLTLHADGDQLFRVLSNLVRNAAQAIGASGALGTVTIAAVMGEGSCRIDVSDTGSGLPARARENLFQPFAGGVRQGGSGLGLVIAAELVRGHGGMVGLVETGPAGTRFRIMLPQGSREARAVGR